MLSAIEIAEFAIPTAKIKVIAANTATANARAFSMILSFVG